MLQERMHEFDEELFNSCPDNIDLFGYYQSPKYFEHIKDEIKSDFTFSKEVEAICSEMFDSIHSDQKVDNKINLLDRINNFFDKLLYKI